MRDRREPGIHSEWPRFSQPAFGSRATKPGNIMLLSGGQVRILDVGIGRIATTERSLTRTGLITGTRHYVAPEQVQGRSGHPSDKDPRTRARRPPAPRNGAIGG